MDLTTFLTALESTNASTIPSIIRALQTAKTQPVTKTGFIKLLDVTQTPGIGIVNKLKKAKIISYDTNDQGEITIQVNWVPTETGNSTHPFPWINDKGKEHTEFIIRTNFAGFNLWLRDNPNLAEDFMQFVKTLTEKDIEGYWP